MWLASTCFRDVLRSESHEFHDGTGKRSLLRSDRAHLKFGDPVSCYKILKDLPSVFKVDSRTSDKNFMDLFPCPQSNGVIEPGCTSWEGQLGQFNMFRMRQVSLAAAKCANCQHEYARESPEETCPFLQTSTNPYNS
jgi:hypothetical protein